MIKQQIEDDLKVAMLAGDKTLVQTLRGLKSALLYVEVAEGKREQGLTDEEAITVLSKEAKKRTESAEMYGQGGDDSRKQAELLEKQVIERYLPKQLSESEIASIVAEEQEKLGVSGPQAMGQLIGAVKARTAGSADGATIARLVKERLA